MSTSGTPAVAPSRSAAGRARAPPPQSIGLHAFREAAMDHRGARSGRRLERPSHETSTGLASPDQPETRAALEAPAEREAMRQRRGGSTRGRFGGELALGCFEDVERGQRTVLSAKATSSSAA